MRTALEGFGRTVDQEILRFQIPRQPCVFASDPLLWQWCRRICGPRKGSVSVRSPAPSNRDALEIVSLSVLRLQSGVHQRLGR